MSKENELDEKRKKITANYQLAHEEFTRAREQVNDATRMMRKAERRAAAIANELFELEQLRLKI